MIYSTKTPRKVSLSGTYFFSLINRITRTIQSLCLILCLTVLSLSMLIYPQSEVEKKISKLASIHGMKVERQPGDILKITYAKGKTRYKAVGEYQGTTLQTNLDSAEINLSTIDTTLYASKYRFFREVPVATEQNTALPVYDVDGDGNAELYGYHKDFRTSYDSLPLKIYEYHPSDSSFVDVYTYPDTIIQVRDVYDIKGSGRKELFATSKIGGRNGVIYEQPDSHSFATMPDMNYYALGQMNDFQFADLDKDGTTDLLYYCMVDSGFTIISRYNALNNTLDSVWRFHENDYYAAGYSRADIDGDGYPDIVEGTIHGKVHVLEYQPGSGYQNIWSGMVETYNAYMHVATNDIDKNGKPEFWVGGDATYNGVAKTRLTCFEATGDNQYQAVARIDLRGVMSFYAGNMFALDVDKNGTEELCLCIDGNFIVIKFVGSPGHHAYETYYIKKTELPDSGFTYHGCSMFDLLNNDTYAIFINMSEYPPTKDSIRYFTRVYLPEKPLGIQQQVIVPNTYKLEQNFPNPFNPSTKISYELPKDGFVSIVVYDVMGKEVKTLVSEQKEAGTYTVNFNASQLPSGMYFYTMKAGDFSVTKKMMLLK